VDQTSHRLHTDQLFNAPPPTAHPHPLHPPPIHPAQSADVSLISEEGPVRTYRLDYLARWSFWKVSGTCTNK